jgi:hypothetical protein
MSDQPHPGRSLEFLSRLHDGELSPAERAHFEFHRAHCAECRKAASEFEEALAFYRTAGTSPASSDLAARILRRLESANPRRSPFGVVFGIDLKWAGAFTAALIAVILGYSVLDRREPERRGLRVSLIRPTPDAAATLPASPSFRESKSEPESQNRAQPRRDAKTRSALKGTGNLSGPPPPLSAGEAGEKIVPAPAAPADRLASARAAPEADAQTSSARSSARALGKVSAEAPSITDSRVLPAATPAHVRINVVALDSYGEPPAILNESRVSLRTEDRGQYVVVVGANGIPIEVARSEALAREKASSVEKTAGETLRKLRFQPSERPRRLLVRVQ